MVSDMTMKYHHKIPFDAGIPGHRRRKNRNGTEVAPAVTIALHNHRCEMIPLAIDRMRRCDIVILEEPPDENLMKMVKGEVSINEYISGIDTEYPEFGRRMALALRRLHRDSIRIIQIEPYLEYLLEIHNRFVDGVRPADLETDTALWPVYEMERRATRALIDFYEASSQNDFDVMLKTTKAFAKVDARRFAMRDRLRARSIARVAAHGRYIYVEAGQMHVGLAQALRQHLPVCQGVAALYLTPGGVIPQPAPASRIGPGDVLTLIYTFNPDFDSPMADLWAARALVQNKIIIKNEITADTGDFPHTRDEAETSRLVHELDLDMCRYLMPLLDKKTTAQARQAVERALTYGKSTTGHGTISM